MGSMTSISAAGHERVEGYNAGAMVLHWAIAIAILFQLMVGFAMSRLDVIPDGLRFAVFQWHKTVGISVLALTLARIAWRLFNPPPAGARMPLAERRLAGLVHALFYALMLLVPLSGWLVVSVSPTKIPTLLMLSESLPWPNLPLPASLVGETGLGLAETTHLWLAYSFVALIGLHVAGALKHSLIDRAPSFSRMLPLGRLPRQSARLVAIPIAAAAVAVFLGSGIWVGREGASAPEATATRLEQAGTASGWTIDPAASKLGYSVTFSGKTVTGAVGNWNAAVTFDPADLAGAKADIIVETASVSIDDAFIRSNLAGVDGLDTAAFPKAEIHLTGFSGTETGFLGTGVLRIKAIEAPIAVPFAYAEDAQGAATVSGAAEIDRLVYRLGAGNDAKGEWLAPVIRIEFNLRAKRT
jgi:cytochrome b561